MRWGSRLSRGRWGLLHCCLHDDSLDIWLHSLGGHLIDGAPIGLVAGEEQRRESHRNQDVVCGQWNMQPSCSRFCSTARHTTMNNCNTNPHTTSHRWRVVLRGHSWGAVVGQAWTVTQWLEHSWDWVLEVGGVEVGGVDHLKEGELVS